MNDLIERFLAYIYRTHSQSADTAEAYSRDLNQLKDYLEAHSIQNFEDVDRKTFMAFLAELRVLPNGKTSSNATIFRKLFFVSARDPNFFGYVRYFKAQ